MIRTTKLRTLAPTLAVAFVLAACGGGGAATPTAKPATPAATTAATTAPATTAPATATAAPASAAATTAPATSAASPATSSAPSGTPTASSAPPDGSAYSLGYSNAFGIANGFREEQLCTAKAEALVAGVKPSTWIHVNDADYTGGQLQQLRDLVQQHPDAIIFNPNSPDGYQDVLDEAQLAGITTVSIDAYVTDPETWNISNDQVNYGYVGATWLFDKLGGSGNVYYMRGIVGHPADLDRHEGVMKALAEHPGIHLLPSNDGVGTNWDPPKGTELMNGIINDGTFDTIDGIWTSGIDQQVVDAMQAAGKPFVPVVGADLKGFVDQLLHKDPKYDGLEGIAVYNPAAIGGAGVKLAIDVLNGETPETTTIKRTTEDGVEHDIKVVLLPVPLAYPNDTPDGMANLQAIAIENLNVLWPVSWSIDGWTDYTFEQMLPPAGCKGPGE